MARGTPSRPETVNGLGMREGYLMNGYGKRILVVDEDADRRALLEAQLEQEGYAVQTACDGVAGADEMRKRHFEAVIADGRLSEFCGHKLAAYCRISWPDTPVILLSGDLIYVTDHADAVAAAAGLRRPYEVVMLLSVLRAITQPASTKQSPLSRA
jgi:DNA-binding response OmpR family regulator